MSTVQDAVRTVTVPQQRGPVDPPVLLGQAPAPPVRDRRWTAEERSFALGLLAMLVALETIIVAGLLLYGLVGA